METPKEVSGGAPPPPQRLKTFIRQNSEKLGRMAETVVLPMNKRSFKKHEDISLDVEGKEVGATGESHSKQFPFFMILVALLQVVLFYTGGEPGGGLEVGDVFLLFAYDPHRRHELWRYFTMMLVHSSWYHLWENVVFQLIMGCLLEVVHHWKRISILYMSGVLGGSLAVSVLSPQIYSLGASAGVYALFAAHIATTLMNWNEMDNKCCRIFWLLLYTSYSVGLSVYFELILKQSSNVSNAAHFGGAIAGFIVGVLVLRNFEKHPWERRLQKILGVLIAAVVVINVGWPSHYKETEWNTNYFDSYAVDFLQTLDVPTLRDFCLTNENCTALLQKHDQAGNANTTTNIIELLKSTD